MTSKVSPSEKPPPGVLIEDFRVGPEITTRTNSRGLKLHCRYWKPKEKHIRGLVFMCHGFGEHLQWYEDLAIRLVSCGLLAFGHDHVGHGRSEGTRGHVTSAEEYINDVISHCDEIRKLHKGKPCYIIGHSMGGMISIRAAMQRPFDGVVLIGPLIQPDPGEATPFKIGVAKVIASILPLMPVGKLNPNFITRDEEMRRKVSKDPLRYHGGVRARWAMACLEELAEIEASMEKISWPFLILHGEKDQLCSPSASELFYKTTSSSDKKIKIIPHAYHHLYIEKPEIRTQALEDTVDWIDARANKEIVHKNGIQA